MALGESGAIFMGINLEFPGLPLHNSVHAEQVSGQDKGESDLASATERGPVFIAQWLEWTLPPT